MNNDNDNNNNNYNDNNNNKNRLFVLAFVGTVSNVSAFGRCFIVLVR